MKAKHFFTVCGLCCGIAISFAACKKQPAVSAENQFTEQSAASTENQFAEQPAAPTEEMFTDIELPNPEGKTIKVSDYVGKNKYVLIDFWASWCGPCRAEMPTVVKAYADYHQKGLEVVGVSLDSQREAWVKAIDQLKMPWPQMSDLKGWECQGARAYDVNSIPANVLVDEQGRIVARDLRGEDLLNTLDELLK